MYRSMQVDIHDGCHVQFYLGPEQQWQLESSSLVGPPSKVSPSLQARHMLRLQARHLLCLQPRHLLCQQTRDLQSRHPLGIADAGAAASRPPLRGQ